MKPDNKSFFSSLFDSFKKLYITKLMGFDPSQLAVSTLLFEGALEVGLFFEQLSFDSGRITTTYQLVGFTFCHFRCEELQIYFQGVVFLFRASF